MSVTLAPPMFLQFLNPNNSGSPAVAYQLFTYIAGTSTKQATWTDSTQAVENANPLELDGNGVGNFWGDPTLAYKFVWAPANDTDPPTSPLRTVDNLYFPLNLAELTQQVIGTIINPRTAAEIAAGVTPTNYSYTPGNVLRYGADPTGTLDSTTAFQSAHNGNSFLYIPPGAFLLNQITPATMFQITKSNFEMYGEGECSQLVHTSTALIPVVPTTLVVSVVSIVPNTAAISNVRLRNFRISGPTPNNGTARNASNYCLGLCFNPLPSANQVTDCYVEGVVVEKMQMAGICLNGGAPGAPGCQRIRFFNCIARYGRQDGFNDFSSGNLDIVWDNCHAHDLDGYGHEHGTPRLLIQGGSVQRCGQGSIALEYDAVPLTTNRRTIQGVLCTDAPQATTGNGLIQLGEIQNPYQTDILGCTLLRCPVNGIQVNGSAPNAINIIGNTIQDVGSGGASSGISFSNVLTNSTITNNSIVTLTAGYTMAFGIALAASSSSVGTTLIADNNIVGATTATITGAVQPYRVRRGIPSVISLSGGNSNTGSAETTLMSYTLPANTLDTVNQSIKIKAWGITAANGNAKRVRIYFGSTVICDTTALTANNLAWSLEALVTVETLTIIVTLGWGTFNSAIIPVQSLQTTGQSFTVSNLIKVTGLGVATGDIGEMGLLVEFPDSY